MPARAVRHSPRNDLRLRLRDICKQRRREEGDRAGRLPAVAVIAGPPYRMPGWSGSVCANRGSTGERRHNRRDIGESTDCCTLARVKPRERSGLRPGDAAQRSGRDDGAFASQLAGCRGQQEAFRGARRHRDQAGRFRDREVSRSSRFLHLRPGAAASSGGTEGTVINHVGFLVPNVQEAVAKWKAAGVAVAPGSNERIDQAWITTADGLRVEILEDKNQTIPIRHHHVHFYVPQSAISDMQAWYAKHFGAKPGMRGQFQAADIPGANLTFTKTDTPTVPTKGRILDHIGFDVKDLAAFAKKLEAAGIKLDQTIVTQPTGAKLTFIHDPWGTSIELNERPNPL